MPSRTQVLRNSGEQLRVTFTIDGVATDPDGQAATVTITADDGTAVATAATAARISAGVYGYVLAPQADLDVLTAVWSATFSAIPMAVTTTVEIVGGYYVSLAELRALPNLSDTTKFTTADLIDARQWFETKFERYTGRAFVPRYRRLVMWGSGVDTMQLPDQYIRTLRTVSFGTVDLSDAALANIALEASGQIRHFWPLGINGPDDSFGVYGSTFPRNARITLAYEYGLDQTPDDVADAAKQAIRSHLLNDETGRPMLSIADGAGGTTRFATPGPNRPFGIPDVDAVANDRRRTDRQGDTLTVGSVPLA
jgi:hypothetical protein